MKNDLENFKDVWERESAKTIKLLESLPVDAYDFRPDPQGRSLGELAWHLAEAEAFGSFAIDGPPSFMRTSYLPSARTERTSWIEGRHCDGTFGSRFRRTFARSRVWRPRSGTARR